MKKFFSLALTVILILMTVNYAAAEEKAEDNAEKIEFNKKMLKHVKLIDASARDIPMTVMRESPEEVTIFGKPVATREQMVNFIKKRNAEPKINCSVEELVDFYYEEAEREGIRPDIALCQAIKETGTWNYGGDVVPEQNNYCGLGTTGGGVKGAYFETPQLGVRAQIQHLRAYTSTTPPQLEIVDPRYELIKKWRPQIFGKIKTWTGLNGIWAVPGTRYGHEILNMWQQAKLPDGSDKSLEYAYELLATDSDKAAAYVYRGLVYFARENYYVAQADFKAALRLEPELSEALFNLALTQEKLQLTTAAIETYDKYLELNPDNSYAYYNRGRLELAQKKYNTAIVDFQSALEIEGRFADAQNEIAIANFRQGKYEEALKDIRTAAKINTTNKVINENLERLEACVKS
ncbi:MAG: glucosaminidase domain-containing protein [Selenomonadaceae bacterium]|nr:glucosaminidase domain-containing protein [Selenomonadaceae bacterium]